MKFHKDRTVIKSPLEGIAAYRKAFQNAALQYVPIHLAETNGWPGIWNRTSVSDIKFRDDANQMPLEVSCIRLVPRAALVDELTRHRSTSQTFIPVNGSVMAVVAPSMVEDNGRPDPKRIAMVPVLPGEAIEVAAGTWHTLPFSFTSEVLCLSIMHREDLDSYHDVRDLAAEGWIGLLEWLD